MLINFIGMTIITDPIFTAYLFGVLALVFLHPRIVGKSSFFDSYFKEHYRKYKWESFMGPPGLKVLSLLSLFCDASLATSILYYLYANRDPVTNSDGKYYVSIEALWIGIIALKYLWFYTLFNYHRRTVGMIMTMIDALALCIVTITTIVLLGVREQWVSFAFTFPPLFFYILFTVWTFHIWRHMKTGQ